jgi:predicted aspartyl protease
VETVAVATILNAYDRATDAQDITTLETAGTVSGEGLNGDFHSWRSGTDELDVENLGPRSETTLRRGDRLWVRNANGNVRRLTGILYRRALTDEFIESGAFVHAPSSARFVGFGDVGSRHTWRLEVEAKGGEPETLWIDTESGLPLRTEYLDGDGPTYVDVTDWRTVEGRKIGFRSVTTDGDRAYDIVEQTTSIHIDGPIDPVRFEPLIGRTLQADGVQTVPLLDVGAHLACTVTIAGKPYTFLIDSGAQNVLLDSKVAADAGLAEVGALEVRGATRSGGLHVAQLPRLEIGTAHLDDLVVSTIGLGPSLGPLHVDGILGYPFFASSVVELDPSRHTLRFGPPGSFQPQGERIALDLDREIPEATFGIDGRVDAPFMVDTGNSGELLFYRYFLARHPGLLPASGPPSVNYGVGGSDRTYRTQLDELRLGSVSLYRQNVDVVLANAGAFADRIDAGNVGLGILRNFVVTFDFSNDAMYLQPGTSFDDGRRRAATI